MLLLDIIFDPRRIEDTARVIKPVVCDTVATPEDTTVIDSVATTFNASGTNQQLADIAPVPSHFLGLPDDVLLSVVVVLAALALCFYFVKRYRKSKSHSS